MKRIEGCAFDGCSGLTNVTIPNSVTSIDGFSDCTGLTSITIPNSVTSIEGSAFSGCSGLTSVTIPNSVKSIGNFAFQNCSGLTSVTISNSIKNIGIEVFSGCSGLTEITIPNSVTSIGKDAFSGCSGLTEIYSLNPTPPSANTDKEPFNNNVYRDATLYVPEEALTAYKKADCWKNFQNIQSIESKVLSLDYDDKKMTATVTGVKKDILSSSIVIPETTTHLGKTYTVTAIGYEALKGCTDLTEVTIPNSVRDIMDAAFSDCSSLTSITLPSSVGYIGEYAFYGSTHFTL